MQEFSDIELLRSYGDTESEEAFAAIVNRHINMVYSTAVRQVGNPEAAKEITQAVFFILSTKAKSLGKKIILSGWLYQTARFTSANYLKKEIRRIRREQEAYMQSLPDSTEPDAWPQLAPLLESAMGRLSEKDRNAVVLRFFENRNLQEVGAALGTSEDAAKMRVSRALEKLRTYFAKHGITASSAGIAAAISANTVHAAPAGLALSVAAVTAKGSVVGASTLALAKGALKLMTWANLKTSAAAWGTAALVATGATAVVVTSAHSLSSSPSIDISGSWQGTGEIPDRNLKARGVLHITKAGSHYRATLDVLDRGIRNLPMQLSYEHRNVSASLDLPWMRMVIEGTLNDDGTQISGAYREETGDGGKPTIIPLVLNRTRTPDSFPEPMADWEYAPRSGSDLQGYWKGMYVNRNLTMPLTIRISEGTNGTFRAQFESLCEGVHTVPASVSYSRPRVRIDIPGFGIYFEGNVDATRSSISGIFNSPNGTQMTFAKLDATAEAKWEASRSYAYKGQEELQGHWKAKAEMSRAGKSATVSLNLHVARLPDGSFSAALDYPASLRSGIASTRVRYEPPYVRIDFRGIDSWFEGKLKGGRLDGQWHELLEGAPMPAWTSCPAIFERTSTNGATSVSGDPLVANSKEP